MLPAALAAAEHRSGAHARRVRAHGHLRDVHLERVHVHLVHRLLARRPVVRPHHEIARRYRHHRVGVEELAALRDASLVTNLFAEFSEDADLLGSCVTAVDPAFELTLRELLGVLPLLQR